MDEDFDERPWDGGDRLDNEVNLLVFIYNLPIFTIYNILVRGWR